MSSEKNVDRVKQELKITHFASIPLTILFHLQNIYTLIHEDHFTAIIQAQADK